MEETVEGIKKGDIRNKFKFPSKKRPSLQFEEEVDKEVGDKYLANLWKKLKKRMEMDNPSKTLSPPVDSNKANRSSNLLEELEALKSYLNENRGKKSD